MIKRTVALITIITTLAGCAVSGRHHELTVDPALLDEIRGEVIDIPAPPSVLALSPEIKAFVDRHVSALSPAKQKLEKLRDIIFDEEMLDLQYESGTTRTAIETFEHRRGNCLSMTNLFIAMARYTGLDANYHVVPTMPWWDATEGTMIWNEHINAKGKLRIDEAYVLDFVPEPVSALENRDKVVSDEYALALYHNNLGAEALVNGQNAAALDYLRIALAINPNLANIWNNMAMVQRRLGRMDLAEASLLHALKLDASHPTVMSNLAGYYTQTGDVEAAEYFTARVKHHRNSNPFYLYARGTQAMQVGDTTTAVRAFRRAIRYAPDRAEFYFALHQVYKQTGKDRKSKYNLRKAIHFRNNPTAGQSPGTLHLISDPDARRFLSTRHSTPER